MKVVSSLMSASTLALLSAPSAQAYSEGFDLTDHTSQLNFYHQAATNLTAEQVALDDSCVVDQVHMLMRHGTRYPSSGSYSAIKSFAETVTEYLSWSNMSNTMADELEFLKTWNLTELIPNPAIEVDNITSLGLQEAYDVGSTFRSKYAGLYTSKETVWTNAKERVVRTAQSFMKGFHGQDWDTDLLVAVSNTDKTLGANTLTPIDTCPNFDGDESSGQTAFSDATGWQVALAERLESLWPGFGFSTGVALTVMDLCMYQRNYLSKDHLEFCKIFTDDEWRHYAYHKDLGYYYGSGYGVALAPTVGFPYAEAVTNLLNETETSSCQKIFVAFSQDTQLNAMYSGFGLNYDENYPTDAINATRNFRSSRVVTMGARLVTERINCGGQRYVRFNINEQVVPLPGCQSGPGLTCSIAEYLQYMKARQSEVGDFITKCNAARGSSQLTLFENPAVNQCNVSSGKPYQY
ncbi:multiple inositol polyphosphate phosphatase [Phytophthora cinnamomi]|uniref:multiple inositol polyphosphate phosphatase n=1 Tax=Phytophthora cinnamomi TaxID=4785 RepID=UPI00355A6208|nr:multiple inositol polyphosphate phosphatase [Phytophthora cinnamomi]